MMMCPQFVFRDERSACAKCFEERASTVSSREVKRDRHLKLVLRAEILCYLSHYFAFVVAALLRDSYFWYSGRFNLVS